MRAPLRRAVRLPFLRPLEHLALVGVGEGLKQVDVAGDDEL